MPRPVLQILLAITVLFAANFFWDPATAPIPDAETSERQQALPKTYLYAARTWSYDESGSLSDILEAEKVEQFPQKNVSNITAPRFYSHSKDDKTWSISAKRGRYFHRGERLLLRNKVVLVHDQTGTRMDTHALDIYVETKIAESKMNVTITQGENRTTAEGMIANLDQETINLKPNVESIYVQLP